MNDREAFDAQREAQREAAGSVGKSTRERLWEGLTKYLSVEAAHARKSAKGETEKGTQRRGT